MGKAILAAIFVLTVIRVAAAVNEAPANKWDDHQAYYVFPVKMLQLGRMGEDPYSERRAVSALGGMSFLHALVLARLDFNSTESVDAGIGFVFLVMLVFETGRLLKLRLEATAAAALFVTLIPPYWNNATGQILTMASLLAMFLIVARGRDLSGRGWSADVLLGVVVGGLCTLKSNLIPAAALFCLAACIEPGDDPRRLRQWRVDFGRAVRLLLLTGAIMLPWMIEMHRSSGTYLYPLLGKGWLGPPYSSFPSPTRYVTSRLMALVVLRGLPGAIALWVMAAAAWRDPQLSRPVLYAACSLILATSLGTVIVGYGVGGQGATRYTMPMLVPQWALIIALFFWLRVNSGDRFVRVLNLALLTPLVLGFFGYCFALQSGFVPYYRQMARLALAGMREPPMYSSELRDEYRAMQDRVPPGQVLLTRLSKPPVLDFRRNPVLIMDWPDWPWPPPGLPHLDGPETLAAYLHARSVRYLAYSYYDQCGLKGWEFRKALSKWDDDLHAHAVAFQNDVMALSKTRKVLFDDGKILLIDVARPK